MSAIRATCRFLPIIFFIYAFFVFPTCAQTNTNDYQTNSFDFLHLRHPVTRVGFDTKDIPTQPIVLLQDDGIVEFEKTFSFVLPPSVSLSNVKFNQSSSDLYILNHTLSSSTSNIYISHLDQGAVNVTCALTLDSMVGTVRYTLIAVDIRTDEVLDIIPIWFRVVGMTIYRELPSGDIDIVSGEGNEYVISYQQAMETVLIWQTYLKVFIQYADGSTSSAISGTTLPKGDSLKIETIGNTGQVIHDADNCDVTRIGQQLLLANGIPDISPGCGFGFFSGSDDHLAFGFVFREYRVGSFSLRFTWVGINENYSALVSEYLDLSLHIRITGTPPLVVVGIDPINNVIRQEGGEVRTVKMINVKYHLAIIFELRVFGVEKPFMMIPGTYKPGSSPDYVDEVSCLTQPGSGVSLTWNLYYQTKSGSIDESPYEKAMFHPSFIHLFSYDTNKLHIDSIDPRFGNEDGGTTCTMKGYFPFFNKNVDAIRFSGMQLPVNYITYVSQWEIRFTLPPRFIFGSSYDFRITVNIGFGQSNHFIFSYYVTRADVSFRFNALVQVTMDTYKLTDCLTSTVTAMIAPYTNQIVSYEWGMYGGSNVLNNLFETDSAIKNSVNATAESIRLKSDLIAVGTYLLKVKITLLKAVIESDIILVRENTLSIGSFIAPVGNQSLDYLGSVLRMTAFIQPPNCDSLSGRLMFEWKGFGTRRVYSSSNVTDVSAAISKGDATDTAATRLGLQFTIPRDKIDVGSHNVTFRSWISDNNAIYGSAWTTVHVKHGPLVAVVRSGEKRIEVNYLTILTMYANNSYDTSLHDDRRFEGISYEWSCLQSYTEKFLPAETSSCSSMLLEDASASEFKVPINSLQLSSSPNVHFIKYSLVVRKGSGRVSPTETLVVEIRDGGSQPFLDNFSVSVTDAEDEFLCKNGTAYYEDIILHVNTGVNSTWAYELVTPTDMSFFSPSNIIDQESYFYPATDIESNGASQKPLGIRANAFNPSSEYCFQITFYGGENGASSNVGSQNPNQITRDIVHETTHVLYCLRTLESANVHMSDPAVTLASTETHFALTTGVSTLLDYYIYYFLLTDQVGNEYCVGGCTGMDITYFQFTREANYTLHSYVSDARGRLVTFTTASTIVVVNNTLSLGTPTSTLDANQYQVLLNGFYEFGNDRQWVHTAHDASLLLVPVPDVGNNINSVSRKALPTGKKGKMKVTKEEEEKLQEKGLAMERQLGQEMDLAMAIANDSTRLFCNTFSSTFFGQDCVKLVHRLSQMHLHELDTFYFMLETASCCIKKTPSDALLIVIGWVPQLISNLGRLARTWTLGANTRRRLLQDTGEPANAVADVNIWTSSIIACAAASGMVNGFFVDYDIGYDDVMGHVSVAVASEPSDLKTSIVGGVDRNILPGPSDDELFYARDSCFVKLFGTNQRERRVLTMLTTDNFILLGFQDPPVGSNLVDKLYWTQVFERGASGLLQEAALKHDSFCYCWRLPVIRYQEELENSVDDMPGLYGFNTLKELKVDANIKGEVFKYDYANSKTSDYNTTQGWVEGCRIDVGIVSTTVVSKSSSNILDGGLSIMGFAAWAIVGLVVGGVMLVMVAVVSSWLVAVRAMSDGSAAPVGETDAYVERDVYGRSTGTGENAARMQSTDAADEE